jgi:uncharacterized protein YuzE
MAGKSVKVWFDPEGDYLEILFEQRIGFFRATENEQVMEKVDEQGNLLGFSIMKVSSLKSHPLEMVLT